MVRAKKDPMSKSQSQVFPKDLFFASPQNPELIGKKHHQIVDGASKIFFKKAPLHHCMQQPEETSLPVR
jgi:hypothetical protein